MRSVLDAEPPERYSVFDIFGFPEADNRGLEWFEAVADDFRIHD